MRLLASTPYGRVNDTGARLFPAVSADAAIVQAVRPFDLLRLVSGSGGGAPSKGHPARAVSSPPLLSVPFCPLLSACSRVVRVKVVSRKVVKSKVVRES